MRSMSSPESFPPAAGANTPEPGTAFDIRMPDTHAVPLVFASPHSGNDYPPEFVAGARLDPVALRRSEDGFVDDLFAAAPEYGAPLLRALFPRAFIDANREPFELDQAMFSDRLPGYVNTESSRVAAGLGTIAKVVSSGQDIYPAGPRCRARARRFHHRRLFRQHLRTLHHRCDRARDPGLRLRGRPQQTVRRRFHHPTLRPAARRGAHLADRNQPRTLYGRDQYPQKRQFRPCRGTDDRCRRRTCPADRAGPGGRVSRRADTASVMASETFRLRGQAPARDRACPAP